MTESYFLWPKSRALRGFGAAYRFTAVGMIEKKLQEMFSTGHAVLCSSGRSALVLALTASGASRDELVGVFPYASHCVLDAVARVATPLSGPTSISAQLRIVYHQWGYVQENHLPANAVEDCVDTLCVPGTDLFPGGGRFEIWSFPKILGTTSGGVLWCRDELTAARLRNLRDEKGAGLMQWLIRLLGVRCPKAQLYWQGAESVSPGVSRLQTGEIWGAISRWDAIVSDRLKKLDMVWPFAVEWLPRPSNRLPPVVPVLFDSSESIIAHWGISSGLRWIERVQDDHGRKLIRLLPIPIHHDISESWLVEMRKRLVEQKSRDCTS